MHPQSTISSRADVLRPCQWCGAPFFARVRAIERGNGRFCSLSCSSKHRRSRHITRDLAERFWSKVNRSTAPDGCWLWTASLNGDGYGKFGMGRRTMGAHVVAYELTHGPVPDGLWVLHNCPDGDKRACCNPAHLWLGDNGDNVRDAVKKGRHAWQSHPEMVMRGEDHRRSKVSDVIVGEIRQRAVAESPTVLAADYGISVNTIRDIVCRRTWKHVG